MKSFEVAPLVSVLALILIQVRVYGTNEAVSAQTAVTVHWSGWG